jgi:hypothetical protein
MRWCGLYWTSSGYGRVESSGECGKEISGSINAEKLSSGCTADRFSSNA